MHGGRLVEVDSDGLENSAYLVDLLDVVGGAHDRGSQLAVGPLVRALGKSEIVVLVDGDVTADAPATIVNNIVMRREEFIVVHVAEGHAAELPESFHCDIWSQSSYF